MVHGAGGTLLEHVKEHRLHGDLGPEDTLYFHTTTAWMMWNWQLSALAVGAHVVVNDGPVAGPETLWELVAEHGVTVFGTSPAYLQLCQDAGYRPADGRGPRPGCAPCSPPARCCTTGSSTGWPRPSGRCRCSRSPAAPTSSAASCSAPPTCPSAPAAARPAAWAWTSPRSTRTAARSWARSASWSAGARSPSAPARLPARPRRRPLPRRPTSPSTPGMWTHGDLIEFDPDGSARLHGRSDGVLNIDGVRIGPSEIYTVLRGRARRSPTPWPSSSATPAGPGHRGWCCSSSCGRAPGSTATWTGPSGARCAGRRRPRTCPRWWSPSPSCRSPTTASAPSGPPATR